MTYCLLQSIYYLKSCAWKTILYQWVILVVFHHLNMLFVWLTISNCLKMWRYDGYDGYEECKNVYRKQIKKTSIFICLTFLCHKLANYKDALHRNFSKIDSPKIVSWNESLSVFKLRYLEDYVMDWNRWKSKFVHTLLESKIFWQ